MRDPVDKAPAQTGFLSEPMELPGICLFGLFLILLSVGLAYLLWAIWPVPPLDSVSLLGGLVTFRPDIEFRLLVIAALSGALGAFIHSATSFATYVGNRQLIRSWAWWYGLRPFIGMALGLIVYFLLRGGFLSPQAQSSAISPYGVAAISGLAGLFSKQASDKLKEVFEQIFPTGGDQRRRDSLRPDMEDEGATSGGKSEGSP